MFLAVAAALAADSWRITLSEKLETGLLVDRLLADLNVGVDQLELDRNRTAAAREAAARLITDLQTSAHHRSEFELVQDFVTAARTGYYDFLLVHDSTYSQLHGGGRLGKTVGSDVEVALIEYYQYINLIKSLWASTPQAVNTRFHRITAIPPITVTNASELPSATKNQILDSISNDPAVLDDLRELHAMLSILVLNDVFQRAIDSSQALSARLEALAG